MSESKTTLESTQSSGIMQWLIAISKIVNADNRLVSNKAVQKRLQEFIEIYGAESVWGASKQLSTVFGMPNAQFVEALFQSYPNLPEILKQEEVTRETLNQWFEQNSAFVTRFHKVATTALRVNPVIEWQSKSSQSTPEDIEPILDLIFHTREDV